MECYRVGSGKFMFQLLQEKDDAGLTLLGYSVLVKDNTDIARYLTEEGCGVDIKDNCAVSALHWACWNGDTDTISLLLEYNADVFSRDVTGMIS